MSQIKFWPIISACSVGIGAYFGAKYERWHANRPSVSNDKIVSYFPWTSDVFAASLPVPESRPYGVPQSSSTAEIMKFGFPSLENIRTFNDFVLAYDRRNRNAHWVFEHLTPDKLPHRKDVDRKYSIFYEDEAIHEKFRSTLTDYKYSGYDRGHLGAAGNHRHDQRAMDQTFVMSNISPQVGEGFNRGIWNSLEMYVRAIARKHRNTYICTGPLYLPRKESDGKMYVKYEVIGKNNVAVPTHFFKVVAVETNTGDFEILSYVLPNQPMKDDTPLSTFLTPVDAIERAAGFHILEKLPRNKLKLVNGQRPR